MQLFPKDNLRLEWFTYSSDLIESNTLLLFKSKLQAITADWQLL